MLFIVVKFATKPEWSERWLEHVREFTEAMRTMPQALIETPRIINTLIDADEWGRMGELTVE